MNGTLLQKPSARRVIGMVVGIVIIGLGIALFKQSHLGNDSISALNMRLAELFGISLGVQNIAANLLMFAIEIWVGRQYIGLGTFVNGICIGFIVTAFYDPLQRFSARRRLCRSSCSGWRQRSSLPRWGLRSTRRQTLASPLTTRWRWSCGTTRPCPTLAAVSSRTRSARWPAGCWAAW